MEIDRTISDAWRCLSPTKSSMSTRKRSHRSPHSDAGSRRRIDESSSLKKRVSTKQYRLNSIVMSKQHELDEGEIKLESLTTSPDQKKHSQESLSKTHEHCNFPNKERSEFVKLSNEAKIKDDSWKQLFTKHGSVETKTKISSKQTCEDGAKNERNSSLNAPKWEYEPCIKDTPKTSSHKWGSNECRYYEETNTSLQGSSSKLDDENRTKDTQNSSSSRWSSWNCKEADTNITHKSSSAKWDSWPCDDIKAESLRNGAKWGSEIDNKDLKKFSNPKPESRNSKETKTDQSYMKDSHKSSNSKHSLWSSDVAKWSHGTSHGDTKKSSCPKWRSWDSKKTDSNSSGNVTKWGCEINTKGSNGPCSPKWNSRNSTGRNMNSSVNDSKMVAETNAVDALKSSGPEWSSWDSEKNKSDSSWYVSKWISEIHKEYSKVSSSQKWSSWDSKLNNINSTLEDTKHAAETNAKDALTLSVPKWDSSNYNEAKTNSEKDSCNLKGSNTNSSWDGLVVETNSKDADKSSCSGWGSWDTTENKKNPSWNCLDKSSRSNWESCYYSKDTKATLSCTDISWSGAMNTKNSSNSFSPRQGGSKAPIDCWNSRKSNTTSWNDSKWKRETNNKNTTKWGESAIDRRVPRSARHNSYNDRHFDKVETWKRTSSDPKSKDHRLNTSVSKFKDSCIRTDSKLSSCKEQIDEKINSKSSQNDSKWGSWNNTKVSESHIVSSWSGPKWGDQTTINEGASNSLPSKCPKRDNQEDSNSKKEESNSALSLNSPKQRENDTGIVIYCSPTNTRMTSENRNRYAMNNETSAPCEAFQKTTPSGMQASNNEAFGYDQCYMKFPTHHSNNYIIEHNEDNKVKENDENKKLPPIECRKQSLDTDLNNKAKSVTQHSAKTVTLDPHHLKNKAAVDTSNIWAQSSSAAGDSNSNQSTKACGTKIVEGKEDRGILMLKSAVADFAKDILKPYWKGGHLNIEDHKTIVKKVVYKVMGSLQENVIFEPEKFVGVYMSYNRIKLTNLVAAYLENFQTAQTAKKMELTNIP